MATASGKHATANLPQQVREKIEAAVGAIGYGSVTIIVQDGKVIQIEISEKIRLA